MNRYSYACVGLIMLAGATSCGGDDGGLPGLPRVDKECGFVCPGDTDADGKKVKGVLEGNAAISGVASVDAFFAAVNNFRGSADNVSAGINAELGRIKADFGIDAKADLKTELDAKIKANLEGGVTVDYTPARCAIDAKATIEAKARCEAKVDPGEVNVECKGSCQIEANAELKCDAGADLQCTFTGPTVDCKGECSGSCEAKLDAAASCSGTCRGTCSGSCSAYSDAAGTKCAGTCSGMCTGTCEAHLEASAKCMGTCKGECKVSGPDVDCKGSAHAECKAKADASVMCKGKCEGDVKPPSASAECEASAKAEAKLNVQCTPPAIAVNYRLKAGVDAMAQARFEAALKSLAKVRLPALVAATARAKLVAQAGEDLTDAAEGAVKASISKLQGSAGIKAKFTLVCALGQLPEVTDAVAESADKLTDSLNDSVALTAVLGMK
ncbi:MAG TPA: hypothetical protein VJV78_23765 [Polyangiales bacterium]|nr:hypothetical protein [Polyangiales bacterium]